MPVAVHINPNHMSREDYQQAIGELEKCGVHEGRMYHAAYGDDDVQIFEVWRSREAFDAGGDQLVGVLQGVGVNVDSIDVSPLHSEHPD